MLELRIAPICLASFMLVGCATLPDYKEDPVTTAEVIRHIKCEIRDAVRSPENAWLKKWNVGIVVTLEAMHSGGLDGDATWVLPLNPGILTIALTSGFSGQATREEKIDFKESLGALATDRRLFCPEDDPGDVRHALLGGRLGILDLFWRAGASRQIANIRPKIMNYNLDFLIKKDASASPKFSMIPIGKNATFAGGIKWTGSRRHTNSLDITLTPDPAPCPVDVANGDVCPIPVYTVERPDKDAAPGRRRRGVSTPGGLTPEAEDRLDRAQNRNAIESIDRRLRTRGISN